MERFGEVFQIHKNRYIISNSTNLFGFRRYVDRFEIYIFIFNYFLNFKLFGRIFKRFEIIPKSLPQSKSSEIRREILIIITMITIIIFFLMPLYIYLISPFCLGNLEKFA